MVRMTWQAEYTNEFGEWWNRLSESEQDDIIATVELLLEHGPHLSHPHSSGYAEFTPRTYPRA